MTSPKSIEKGIHGFFFEINSTSTSFSVKNEVKVATNDAYTSTKVNSPFTSAASSSSVTRTAQENMLMIVEGEEIPFKVLGKYYQLKAKQAISREQSTTSSPLEDSYVNEGEELIELLDIEPWIGPKSMEVRQYVQSLIRTYNELTQMATPSTSSS